MIHNIEWKYKNVDLSTDLTTVESVACLVKGAIITSSMSNHDCAIKDASNTVFVIKSSGGVGDAYDMGDSGTRFESSLIVDPNDSASGGITILYRILNELYS